MSMSLHRALVMALVGLVVLGAALIVLQIWGVLLDGDFFFKLMGTIVVLIILIGFLLVVRQDFGEHKRLKDQNYLD